MESRSFPQEIALQTFRQLPQRLRRRLSITEVAQVLWQKQSYYGQLSYAEKCRISTQALVDMLYRRLRKSGSKRIGPATIKKMLDDEDAYYIQHNSLYA